MKNKSVWLSLIIIVGIDLICSVYIFKSSLEYSDIVACFVTLLAGTIGGVGTLIAVVLSNDVARKQLELSILYKRIEDIKELIQEVLNIDNLVVGLESLDVSNLSQVEKKSTELINYFNKIKAGLISIDDKKLRTKIIDYFEKLNQKVCDLKYSDANEKADKSLIVQNEMLNIQSFQNELEEELQRLYKQIEEL